MKEKPELEPQTRLPFPETGPRLQQPAERAYSTSPLLHSHSNYDFLILEAPIV